MLAWWVMRAARQRRAPRAVARRAGPRHADRQARAWLPLVVHVRVWPCDELLFSAGPLVLWRARAGRRHAERLRLEPGP